MSFHSISKRASILRQRAEHAFVILGRELHCRATCNHAFCNSGSREMRSTGGLQCALELLRLHVSIDRQRVEIRGRRQRLLQAAPAPRSRSRTPLLSEMKSIEPFPRSRIIWELASHVLDRFVDVRFSWKPCRGQPQTQIKQPCPSAARPGRLVVVRDDRRGGLLAAPHVLDEPARVLVRMIEERAIRANSVNRAARTTLDDRR
jgi:hypothetical protein